MYVVFPACGRTIAEPFRSDLHGFHNVAFGFGFRLRRPQGRQFLRHLSRSVPSPEIVGGEIVLGDFSQVIVDIRRVYLHVIAVLADYAAPATSSLSVRIRTMRIMQ